MAEQSWHQARLIPTSGISGAEEQERRATSALLAVIPAVREFGRALLQPLGAPAGSVQTFIEVPFALGERRLYPDGLIRVVRGKTSWTALVEVKTGASELQATQLENYLDVAREQGFDALITISNEIPSLAGQHPTPVDKRKLRTVALHHLSWSQVLTTAVVQKEHRGVADPDQAWVLGELIRYLEHQRSGALEFEDMGSCWVAVRDGVSRGTLRASDRVAVEMAGRFDALLRYASLRLGRQLGTDVVVQLSRRDAAEPALRTAALVDSLVREGRMDGTLRIPKAAAPLHIELDLRAGKVGCHVDVNAPREGRTTTRVNWLVRQLQSAPEMLRLEAVVAHSRGPSTVALLRDVRQDVSLLIDDPKKDLRSFRLALSMPLGSKRGRGRGTAIDSVLAAVDIYYTEVLQHLKVWTAAPPKLREPAELPADTRPVLVSTALSSQDGTEPAEWPPAQ